MTNDCEDWTEEDTKKCENAEASGMAVSKETGNPLSVEELDRLAAEYDTVRSNTTVDEFFNGRVISQPFEF